MSYAIRIMRLFHQSRLSWHKICSHFLKKASTYIISLRCIRKVDFHEWRIAWCDGVNNCEDKAWLVWGIYPSIGLHDQCYINLSSQLETKKVPTDSYLCQFSFLKNAFHPWHILLLLLIVQTIESGATPWHWCCSECCFAQSAIVSVAARLLWNRVWLVVLLPFEVWPWDVECAYQFVSQRHYKLSGVAHFFLYFMHYTFVRIS